MCLPDTRRFEGWLSAGAPNRLQASSPKYLDLLVSEKELRARRSELQTLVRGGEAAKGKTFPGEDDVPHSARSSDQAAKEGPNRPRKHGRSVSWQSYAAGGGERSMIGAVWRQTPRSTSACKRLEASVNFLTKLGHALADS